MTKALLGLIDKQLAVRPATRRLEPLSRSVTKVHCVMKKMIEAISEIVRDTSHPFRKLEHQPKKPLKNRYERRKIKEYLHLTDWRTEEAV